MDVKASLASQAYSQALTAAKPQSKAGEGGGGEAFAAVAGDFFETMREAESTVEAGLVGKADAHSVVEALAATELAVQTAVAVRDKVVEAYQEILRMPV
jgi:flagellar hook-basal body complex protein FliE